MSLRQHLTGTGVALVTPFKSNFDVDLEALGRVIDHVISGGADYVVTLGTTGETPTLSKEERLLLFNTPTKGRRPRARSGGRRRQQYRRVSKGTGYITAR